MGSGWWGPLHPALHLLIYGAWSWGAGQGGHLVGLPRAAKSFLQALQERRTGPVHRGAREDLEAVGRGQALPPVEHALPPALTFRHVLFQNGQDVSSEESQLVRAVGAVVVKRPGQECLGWGRKDSLLSLLSMTWHPHHSPETSRHIRSRCVVWSPPEALLSA